MHAIHDPAIHDPFRSADLKPPLDQHWAARRELAAALRELNAILISTTSEAEQLRAASAAVRAQSALLQQNPQLFGRKAFEQADQGLYGSWESLSYELSPLDGKSNALASDLRVWVEGDRGHGRVTLGWAYEGPPGAVHGGHVCALFDHLLGIAQIITGQPGVTGALTVRFHLPTPLNCELHMLAQVKEVRGRKNVLSGEIRANGKLTASCEATFIHVSSERFKALRDSV